MSTRTSRIPMVAGLMLVLAAPRLDAQLPTSPQPPQIVTTATEEVEVDPDRAMLSLSVETRAKTAAAAGAENARIQTAVLDTLRKLGIANAQIRTQGVQLNPEYEYPRDGGRPTVVGYQARNAIQVEIWNLGQVGGAIDASLARGVTNIGGLRFFASNTTDARRDAMRKAVARARADAEALAEAAGGRIVGVIEIAANPTFEGPVGYDASPMLMKSAVRSDAPTPIEAGTLKVGASVSARFLFAAR